MAGREALVDPVDLEVKVAKAELLETTAPTQAVTMAKAEMVAVAEMAAWEVKEVRAPTVLAKDWYR